ncbi:hypothetical protein ACRALDRAFT_2040538 [Sodiomyces alcalophilus JCM 7366]|uniref:uncharacterized protein n=1 Tax=Sodiomyces alcalophilus JCM 7366 TaxID=591952 RepID=UPI0039B5E14D
MSLTAQPAHGRHFEHGRFGNPPRPHHALYVPQHPWLNVSASLVSGPSTTPMLGRQAADVDASSLPGLPQPSDWIDAPLPDAPADPVQSGHLLGQDGEHGMDVETELLAAKQPWPGAADSASAYPRTTQPPPSLIVDPSQLSTPDLTRPKETTIRLYGNVADRLRNMKEDDSRRVQCADGGAQQSLERGPQPTRIFGSICICADDRAKGPSMGWSFDYFGLSKDGKQQGYGDGVGWRGQEPEATPSPNQRPPAEVSFICQLCSLRWTGSIYPDRMWRVGSEEERNRRLLRAPCDLQRDPDFSRPDFYQFRWYLKHEHEPLDPCVREVCRQSEPKNSHPEMKRLYGKGEDGKFKHCCPPGQLGDPNVRVHDFLRGFYFCPFDNCPNVYHTMPGISEHLFQTGKHYAYLQALKEWVCARKDLSWADRTICSRLTKMFNNVDSAGKTTIMCQWFTPDQVLTPADPSQHWRWMERLDRETKPKKDRRSKASSAGPARGRSGRGAAWTAHEMYGPQHQGQFQGHHYQPPYQQQQYQPQYHQYQGSFQPRNEQQQQPLPQLYQSSHYPHQ